MTTKHSPLHVLKEQADRIAATLKAAERGEKFETLFAEKIAAAREKGTFKAGIVMDDKIVIITMPWTVIKETDESGIAEFVLKQMRESRDAVN